MSWRTAAGGSVLLTWYRKVNTLGAYEYHVYVGYYPISQRAIDNLDIILDVYVPEWSFRTGWGDNS